MSQPPPRPFSDTDEESARRLYRERGAPPTLRLNKVWGRAVRPTQMRAALRRVFSVEGQLCTTALRHYVSMLERLMSVLETQPCWQLVSSSLLFVFEKEAASASDLIEQ